MERYLAEALAACQAVGGLVGLVFLVLITWNLATGKTGRPDYYKTTEPEGEPKAHGRQ